MDIFEIFEDILSDDEEVIQILEEPRQRKVFRNRPDHMNQWGEQEFIDRFRISKDSAMRILHEIEPLISYPTNRYLVFLILIITSLCYSFPGISVFNL